jgi:Dolichyl-phosphate-mannose-protein mannosyltransferase
MTIDNFMGRPAHLSMGVTAGTGIWLSLILLLSAALGIRGLDWGLPYQWHPDEKIQLADAMIQADTLRPPHFINPSLHVYVIYAGVRAAFALSPGQFLKYRAIANVELTKPDHPDRPLAFLAFRISRLFSVVFQLCTVVLLFRVGNGIFDETTGLLAAWFGTVTMGLVNMAHFATGESLLFFLCLWALWRFSIVADRGWWRDYVLAGLATGLACSTKYTPFVLAVPFVAAHVAGRGLWPAFSKRGLSLMAVTFLSTIVAFVLGSPYSVIEWSTFREALISTWFTGAPGGSLAHVERSWTPYVEIVANALGWPMFVLGLIGIVAGVLYLRDSETTKSARRGYVIHVAWILAFYAFLGLTSHRALRFIMPLGPSLALLAAFGGMTLVRSVHGTSARRIAAALVIAIGVYSTAYAARASHMFAADTRYAAGRWLQSLELPPGTTLDYFTIESYLPFVDQPAFPLRQIPFVTAHQIRGQDFWKEMTPYFANPGNGLIVDADAFYPRYFNLEWQARLPERIQVYRMLFTGQGSAFRPVARFVSHGPWWLDPRPELVCPEIVVFGTPAVVPDGAMMRPMPPPRADVMRLLPK